MDPTVYREDDLLKIIATMPGGCDLIDQTVSERRPMDEIWTVRQHHRSCLSPPVFRSSYPPHSACVY